MLKLPNMKNKTTANFIGTPCKREPQNYMYIRRLPYHTASFINLDFNTKELQIGRLFNGGTMYKYVGLSLLVKNLNYDLKEVWFEKEPRVCKKIQTIVHIRILSSQF